jgi:hypothetical protein
MATQEQVRDAQNKSEATNMIFSSKLREYQAQSMMRKKRGMDQARDEAHVALDNWLDAVEDLYRLNGEAK